MRLYLDNELEILVDTVTQETVYRVRKTRKETRITVKSIVDASHLASRPPCPRKPYMVARDLTKGPGLMKLEPSSKSRKPS